MRTVAIIPCRYASIRFPGKPLALIHGKPMMWHVYQQALKARSLDHVVIATDDERISEACHALGVPVTMTRNDHRTGTDRLAECIASIDADYYVNVQGDEPMIAPEAIDIVAEAIAQIDDHRILAANGFKTIHDPAELASGNTVKVTFNADGTALAYSRQPIGNENGRSIEYCRQLGLYAFRKSGLATFAGLQPGPLERVEHVEMLRFVEHGHGVAMVRVPDEDGIPVDTPADLATVSRMMAQAGGGSATAEAKRSVPSRTDVPTA